MDDEKNIKQVLSDVLDAILALTKQIDVLGDELLAIQIVLEEKIPGFDLELEQAEHAAKIIAVRRDREPLSTVEEVIRNLRNKFSQ